MRHEVRIIGGLLKGKKIPVLDVEGLRPTSNRIRETLFNWLMNHIRGARCLDVFAGSGALGFEAFSRQASRVVMIEHHPQAYVNLLRIREHLRADADRISILKRDAIDYLKHSKEEFDIIFLDPPFAHDYLGIILPFLSTSSMLSQQGLIYVESNQEIPTPPNLKPLKLKKTGQVVYGLYQKLA